MWWTQKGSSDTSKYGHVRNLFTCTLLVIVYKFKHQNTQIYVQCICMQFHMYSMHYSGCAMNWACNYRYFVALYCSFKVSQDRFVEKVVYKAKINSLFTSYKYLQDLKTGFKHLSFASLFKPVFKSCKY